MPAPRTAARALSAILATALALSACGPGKPPGQPTTTDPNSGGNGSGGSGGSGTGGGSGSGGGGSGGSPSGGSGGSSGGTDSGGGTPSGGSGSGGSGSGGSGSGGSGGAGAPSVPTAFADVLGGAGDEWAQDVAALPAGAVVVLTVVGPRSGGAFDQIGLTRIAAGGAVQPGRLYDIGAPIAFPRDGAVATGPGGEIYLALAAQCGTGCKGLGTPVNGSALVAFSAAGAPRWVAPLPGDVASQPVVDPPGNVAVATAERGANVVRSFTAAGAPRWATPIPGAAGDVSLAADAGANVLAARGSEIFKIAPGGAIAWSRTLGLQITGVAGTASGVVVLAGTSPGGPVVVELNPDGTDQSVHPLAGPADDVRVEVGTGRRIGAVSGAGSCGATVSALEVGGGQLWSRPVATAGCDGSELRVSAITVTTDGVVVVAGALAGALDLGGGEVSSKATDALVVGFGS